VEYLINHGADVNGKEFHGWTSLQLAALCGFKNIVEFLLDFEVQLTKDIHDEDYFIWAARNNALSTIIQLVNNGSEINMKLHNIPSKHLI